MTAASNNGWTSKKNVHNAENPYLHTNDSFPLTIYISIYLNTICTKIKPEIEKYKINNFKNLSINSFSSDHTIHYGNRVTGSAVCLQ